MTLKLATLAAVAALAAAPALAQMGPGPHGPGPGGPPSILHLADELDLTEDQQAQIKVIEKNYRDGELGALADPMRDAQKTLATTIHDVAASDEAVTQAASAVGALETRIAVQRHHLFKEVDALLTAEQKAHLAEMKPGAGRGHRRGH